MSLRGWLPGSTLPTVPPGTPWRRWRRDLIPLCGFVLALGLARSSLADHYYVPTGSMIPTVAVGDRVVVSKLAYGLRVPFAGRLIWPFEGPRRGDVVVVESPEDGMITLLKRVVAIPGDEVAVHNGQLWINGHLVPIEATGSELSEQLDDHPHPVRLTRGGGLDLPPLRVDRDRYLLMGDNRGESHDGRAFGLVKRQAIMGQALSVWMRDGTLCWRPL
jgi:signal peptidase I